MFKISKNVQEYLLLALMFAAVCTFAVWSAGAFAAGDTRSIELTWEHPTEREDGTPLPLAEVDGYTLYYTRNGGPEVVVPLPQSTSYTLPGIIRAGYYTFEIATVSEGIEGRRSDPVSVDVPKSKGKAPVIRVLLRLCDYTGACVDITAE